MHPCATYQLIIFSTLIRPAPVTALASAGDWLLLYLAIPRVVEAAGSIDDCVVFSAIIPLMVPV